MKSGASDPFADNGDDVEQSEQSTEDEVTNTTTESVELDSGTSNTDEFNRSDLPYTLRRDKVKDERESVHQLFVQDETEADERGARRDLEDRFDDDIYKLDAREAIYLAGMQNLDDAEAVLRDWGYDL